MQRHLLQPTSSSKMSRSGLGNLAQPSPYPSSATSADRQKSSLTGCSHQKLRFRVMPVPQLTSVIPSLHHQTGPHELQTEQVNSATVPSSDPCASCTALGHRSGNPSRNLLRSIKRVRTSADSILYYALAEQKASLRQWCTISLCPAILRSGSFRSPLPRTCSA